MMRCPKCGSTISLQDAQAEGEWLEIIRLLPEFGAAANLVWEYIELFGIVPVAKKSKKVLRLLQETATLFKTGMFSYQKTQYEVSRNVVVESLRTCCNKGFEHPLENHNYLKKVILTATATEKKGQRVVEEREQRRLEARGERREEEGKLPAERVRELAGGWLQKMEDGKVRG